MEIYSIGFTQKSAAQFFDLLKSHEIRRLLDVRLNNVSQLAGFAKKEDLAYFLRVICGIEYVHLPILAPTQEMLDKYKKQKGDWGEYEKEFLRLMASRRIENEISREMLADACLLCSEDQPTHCHRRLVAEYLKDKWGDVEITHIA